MMKRTMMVLAGLLVLLIAGVAAPVSAEESGDFPVLDKQVGIRQAHLAWMTAVQETRMQAVIEYVGGQGGNVAGLETSMAGFAGTADTIQVLDTHIGLKNAIRQCQEYTREFREEARDQMDEIGGRYAELRARIREAVENNGDLEQLKNRYWEARAENELAIFDIHIDRAHQLLDRLSGHGYDTTRAETVIAEIEALRAPLADALEAQDIDEVRSVQREIHDLTQDFREIIRGLQVEVPGRTKIHVAIQLADRAIERSGMFIDDLARLGFAVDELRTCTAAAANDLDRAISAFEAGHLDGAKDALKNVRDDFRDLRDAYHDLIDGGDLTRATERQVEGMINTLDAADDAIGELE